MARTQNLKKLVNLCEKLEVPFEEVDLCYGYKEVYFTLPDNVLAMILDENGDVDTDKNEAFAAEFGHYYIPEYELWT